jgi:hypothetical protein
MATGLANLDYTLIRNNRWGRLKKDVLVNTGITGYDVAVMRVGFYCHLQPDGMLWIGTGTEWDFGTFAIDTPPMVRASLPHDIFCVLTDEGKLPWGVRKEADKLFKRHLADYSPERKWYNPLRYWRHARYAGVRLNSKTLAYWSRDKYVA